MDTVVEKELLLRSMIRDVIGDDSLASYRTLDITYTLRDTAIIMSLLAAAIGSTWYLHGRFGPIALVAAPLIIPFTAIAFNWIIVQIHEASHILLLPDKTWNDIYCNLALGAWVFQDVDSYRATHGMHHAYLHSDRDPDRWAYTEHVGSVREMLQGFAEDLLLITVLRRYRQVRTLIAANASKIPRNTLVAKLLAQAVVLGLFLYGCGPWGVAYYLVCYAYSLLGVLPVLVRIRTVVQHHDGSEANPAANLAVRFVSRTTVAPFVEFLLVGARMDYHFEHHLFPGLPYYNLRRMHRRLNDTGFFQLPSVGDGTQLRTENYLQSYSHLATSP